MAGYEFSFATQEAFLGKGGYVKRLLVYLFLVAIVVLASWNRAQGQAPQNIFSYWAVIARDYKGPFIHLAFTRLDEKREWQAVPLNILKQADLSVLSGKPQIFIFTDSHLVQLRYGAGFDKIDVCEEISMAANIVFKVSTTGDGQIKQGPVYQYQGVNKKDKLLDCSKKKK